MAGSALYATSALAVASGGAFASTGRTGAEVALAVTSAIAAATGLVGVVSFVSPYVYELPAHRCPFCLLQAEYRWIGYPLYAALLGGAVAGIGAGLLGAFRHHASLAARLPSLQRRLAWVATVLFGAFAAITAVLVLTSKLRS